MSLIKHNLCYYIEFPHSFEQCNVVATFIIYFAVSLVSIFMFGSSISADILDNVGAEGGTWESYVLRAAFVIVVACHIPFVFFAGKEAFLIVIDEATKKTV